MDKTIHNVRFREPVYFLGPYVNNIVAGSDKKAEISIAQGGVLIEVPALGAAPAFATLVPFSNVKQIEYKV